MNTVIRTMTGFQILVGLVHRVTNLDSNKVAIAFAVLIVKGRVVIGVDTPAKRN